MKSIFHALASRVLSLPIPYVPDASERRLLSAIVPETPSTADMQLRLALRLGHALSQQRALTSDSTYKNVLSSEDDDGDSSSSYLPYYLIDAILAQLYAAHDYVASLKLALRSIDVFLSRFSVLFEKLDMDGLAAGSLRFVSDAESVTWKTDPREVLERDDPKTRLRRAHLMRKGLQAIMEPYAALVDLYGLQSEGEHHVSLEGVDVSIILPLSLEEPGRASEMYYPLLFSIVACDLLQLKRRVDQEIELLQFAKDRELTPGGDSGRDEAFRREMEREREAEQKTGEVITVQPLHDIQVLPNSIVSLENVRKDILDNVFVDRNPWSMTIEEFGERLMQQQAEMKQKNIDHAIKEEQQKNMWVAPGYTPEEQEEEERKKQSSWDDWKDENPYGAGNSMRNK
ncbi:mitochondrial TAP42 domain-containing protein [Andalucia godoyi]|uniref:Mitochondrial TAP42 domain-containing protein n=1 Tax=Andalucia godoyi TaxID=505711 RepID=A0A8K0AGY5_ANDGO|nr:mitochondrial TAP42 domain-containing protein [Andalucia godoyi]|eukprot:ANDGO_01862.mRNA.1 mitochondrial TAP42 domain-containing protein